MKSYSHTEEAVAKLDQNRVARDVNALVQQAKEKDFVALFRFNRFGLSTDGEDLNSGAQEVVARELGFGSWGDLQSRTQVTDIPTSEAERAFVISAIVGNRRRCDELLANHDLLARESIAVRCCIAADDLSTEILGNGDVNQQDGPLAWTKLMYLCASRYPNSDEVFRRSRANLIFDLLGVGANPNVGFYEQATIRGYCTALGAAIGFAEDATIARALLSAGAEIDDGPTLYEGSAMWYAVNNCDHEALQVLLDAEPPFWHICHALPHCLALHDERMCEQLSRAGADPNWSMGAHGFGGNCLHEAVMLNSSSRTLEMLLESGAQLSFKDNAGRTPMALAVALNREEHQQMFSKLGCKPTEAGPKERWVSACMAGDEGGTSLLAPRRNEDDTFKFEDHNWLHIAASGEGSDTTLRLLLAGGLDVNSLAYNGERPIHRAVRVMDTASIQSLIEAGADRHAQDFEGATFLDLATKLSILEEVVPTLGADERTHKIGSPPADFLTHADADLFESAADAVVEGDLSTLREILEEKPHFVSARSRRPHRCTLLNYIGVNGFEGERQRLAPNVTDVIRLLLERGSDANAFSYTYRGGPGNNTIGLLTSSGHANENGLALAITHLLVNAGVRVSPEWHMLVELYDHKLEDSLAEFVETLDPDDRVLEATMREAASVQAQEIVAALLERGVNVNSANDQNVTALHNAAINDDVAMVDLLLEAGADPRLRDATWDGNAAGWAYAGDHPELGQRLEKLINDMDNMD